MKGRLSHHPSGISVTQRHALNPIDQTPPAVSLKLCVLHPLLRPLLVRSRNAPDRALEEDDLVAHTLLNEHATSMLIDNRLLVLRQIVSTRSLSKGTSPRKLTFTIEFSTFSASPGFAASPFALIPCNLFSLCRILFSSCGILSLAKRSLRSNRSLKLTSPSRTLFKSSSTPSSHALPSSSSKLWLVPRCFAVALMPSFSSGTSFWSIAKASFVVSVIDVRFMPKRPYSAAMASLRLHRRSTRLQRLM